MSNLLAIQGGNPVVPKELKKSWPIITDEDVGRVTAALRTGDLGGIYVAEVTALEKEFADYIGAHYCLAVNSGTAALHCAVAAVGTEPGDEVITTAYTFLASAAAVLHHNAIPVFVDIDPKTFNINPAKIEERITPKTRAIMPVHIHGMPADMDKIQAVADRHGLAVIEDAAQAVGVYYKGRKAGTLGDIAGFSLQTSKNLMAGEGGLITTNNVEYRDRAALVRMFGEVVKKDKARAYNAYTMGWNYRMPAIVAALARSQLERVDQYLETLQANAARLTQGLRQFPGIVTPFVPEDRTHGYYLYRVRIDPTALGLDIEPGRLRLAVQKAVTAEGVSTMEWQNWPVAGQVIFQQKRGYGKGCPWTCRYAGSDVSYDIHDYPETMRMLDDSFVIENLKAPNGTELMDCYVKVFEKVFDNIGQAIDHYNRTEEYVPLEKRQARLVSDELFWM